MILYFKCACSILEIPVNTVSMGLGTCQVKDAGRCLLYLEDCPGPDCNSSKNISNTLCEGCLAYLKLCLSGSALPPFQFLNINVF